MGKPGPAKAPDNVLALRGTLDRVRPARLKLPPKAPSPPSWLDREAKAEWNRVVPGLDRMGVLATVDRAVLATYCVMWSTLVEANRQMRRDKLVVEKSYGDAKHPLWQVVREAATQIRELAKELYLTPTARLRSEIPEGAAGGPSGETEDDLLD